MYLVNRRWLYGTVIVLVFLAGGYSVYAVRSIPRGGSPTGYALGTAAAALVVVHMLLPWRKRQYQRAMGRLDVWMRAHVALGVICGVLAGMHAGFSVMGTVSIGLTVVFVLTLLSGFAGMALYERLPHTIARMGNRTVQEEGLLAQRAKTEEALERIRSGKSDRFLKAVEWNMAHRAPPLSLNPVQLMSWTKRRVSARNAADLIEALPEPERLAYQTAQPMIVRHADLGRQLFYQRVLRQWLWTHVPLSAALCALLAVHIVSELYY